MTPNPPEFMEVDQSIGSREDGLSYYTTIIEELSLVVAEKNMNVRRLQAQKNELIAKVRLVKKELQLLQEQGCVVGEVVKLMDKNTCKVLVKDIQKVP